MNHDEATRYFDDLGERVPDRRPPMTDLVGAGQAAVRRKGRRTVGLVAGAVALVGIGGAAIQHAAQGDDGGPVSESSAVGEPETTTCPSGSTEDSEGVHKPVPKGPNYPVNENGLTYGAVPDGNYPEPDLIAVVGNCGRSGYADAKRLNLLLDPEPWSTEAGLPAGTPLTIPVFEVDGTTQIDTFTIGGTDGSSSNDNAPSPEGPDAADIQGEWSVTIAGVQSPDGEPQYDTYRDLDLSVEVSANRIQVFDGCQTSAAEFTLADGEFTVTQDFEAVSSDQEVQCDRQAPLEAIVNNIRHVTQSGGALHMHLDNFQIVLTLRPQFTSGADGVGGMSPVLAAIEMNAYPTAGVSGVLSLQEGCLMLDENVVVWPAGTSWDASSQAVNFSQDFEGEPNAVVGEAWSGGGGYYVPSDAGFLVGGGGAAEVLAECVNSTGATEVVFAYPAGAYGG